MLAAIIVLLHIAAVLTIAVVVGFIVAIIIIALCLVKDAVISATVAKGV